MTQNKNSSAVTVLASILFLLIGAGGTYLYLTNNAPALQEQQLGNEHATAMRDNNLLVFIGAEPVNKNYEVFEVVKMDNLFEVADAGNSESGKGKFLKKLLDIGTKAYQNVSFGERISKFSAEAKNEYPNADAIIVTDNFRTASVIKFKQ